MATSKEHSQQIITGNLVKINLPTNKRRFTKIRVQIASKCTQIGDNNKIVDIAVPGNRSQTKDIHLNVKRLDLNGEIDRQTGIPMIFIRAKYVQIVSDDNTELDIDIDSKEVSSLQIGDQCNLYITDSEDDNKSRDVPAKAKHRSPRHTRKKPENKRKKPAKEHKKESTEAIAMDTPECLQLCDRFFEDVQKILHPLRDDGKWCLFDDKWNELMAKYGDDPVLKVLLQLEHGIRVCYHSKFQCPYLEEAEKILCQGRKMIKNLKGIDRSIKHFCEGRFNCYLASLYRRKRYYGRAQMYIERAEKLFQNTECSNFLYDKATLSYEKGSLFHEFDKEGVDNDRARKSFERCYEICKQLKMQEGFDFVKKGQFAQLKKAMLLLGCSTKQGRKRKISDEDLEEAKKCIDEFERENCKKHDIPISEKLQCLLAKSDQFFRMDSLKQAEELASQAANLADKHGFDSSPAYKRLSDIQDRVQGVTIIQDLDKDRDIPHEVYGPQTTTTAQRMSGDADGSATHSTESSEDVL